MHAVISTERNNIRQESVGLLDCCHVAFVQRRVVRRGIRAGRNQPNHLAAHVVETIVDGDVARPENLDTGLRQSTFRELPGKGGSLGSWEIKECRGGLKGGDSLE